MAAPMRVTPVGEWTLSRRDIKFNSRPVAPPGHTVDFAWGSVVLRVRVISREGMMSIGRVLKTLPCPPFVPPPPRLA